MINLLVTIRSKYTALVNTVGKVALVIVGNRSSLVTSTAPRTVLKVDEGIYFIYVFYALENYFSEEYVSGWTPR